MSLFNSLFGKKAASPNGVRETLFGDMPLEKWPAEGSASASAAPWASFVAARARLASGDRDGACAQWRSVLDRPGLEPRHYLQAWHFLRQHEQAVPSSEAKQLLGVVVEVTLPEGLDLLAAYPDHTARYYNYSGAAVVWEHPDASLDRPIDDLLSASRQIVTHIGPWEGARPPAPPRDHARLSFLTPSGLHFGEGPMKALSADPAAGVILQRATMLMKGLVAKTK